MWRAVHSRKISGIGEKASKKRRAIVGIGLVVGARGRGKKEGSGGRKNGVVAGEGRGEESEGWRKRGEGKCGGFPGGNEPSGGDQWAAASFGGVCVRVSAEERLRYAPPRDPPGFAHTQDFGGESLKSGDQDAIGRSGSTVWARPIVARVDNGGGSSLRSASSRRSGFGTLYQALRIYRITYIVHFVRFPPYGSTIFFSTLEKFPPVWIESTFGVVCYSSFVIYIYIYVYCHFELLLAASFFSVLSTSNCFSFHDIVSTIYAIVVGEDSLKNVTTLLDVRHRVECNANWFLLR